MEIVIIIFSMILCSAFFSGMEIAFISANKLQIELDKQHGTWAGKRISWFQQRPSMFIGTMLLGNNIALVIYGIYFARILEKPLISLVGTNAWLILIIQTICSTIIILITAEFLPKSLFRINPNKILNFFSPFLLIIYYVFLAPTSFTIGLAKAILKPFKNSSSSKKVEFGKVDLDHYVREMTERAKSQGEVENEVQIFQNALDFSSVKARECMVPRTDIIALDVDSEIDELKQKFVETGLSKILIYRDTIDNVIGYTHSYEMFKMPERIKHILLPIGLVVPESMPVNKILEQFTKKQKNIALVVDEFGGTSGLITLEDVVEEIFGEIEDEHDREDTIEEQISDTEFLFSARLSIDHINEKFDLQIPEADEYETIAGFIIGLHEDIPEKSEEISYKNMHFIIEQVTDKRIELIRMKIDE